MPGVSRPPEAPARSEALVMATFSTSSVAAIPMVSALLKPSWAAPLPLPSKAGSAMARQPMRVKFTSAATGSLQPRAA
ncbi:hypothetical protein D3C78_1934500 [compost metagenome]